MNRRQGSIRYPTGLSLVELMVAIAVGGILLAGTVSLFVSNKANYEITVDMSRLQENARFALETLAADIRMAGHFGCHGDPTKITNNVPIVNAGDLWDVSNAVEGIDDSFVAQRRWSPSQRQTGLGLTPPAGVDLAFTDYVSGTDAITVRYLQGPGLTDAGGVAGTPDAQVTTITGTAPTPTFTADAEPFGIQLNQVVGISSCGASDVFLANPAGNNVVPQGGTPVNTTYSTAATPFVTPLQAVRYYIGRGAYGGPSLFREALLVGPAIQVQELLEGVENLQILYGVDNDGSNDGVVDVFVTAGNPMDATDDVLDTAADWLNVVSVRIGLLVRTVDQYGQQDPNTRYDVNGSTVCHFGEAGCDVILNTDLNANVDAADYDRRRRRVFTTTVVLRNVQCARPRNCST